MKAFAQIALGCVLLAPQAGAPERIGTRNGLWGFHHENVLGTSLELKVAAPAEADAEKAEAAALGKIDRLAKILGSYDATSEFSSWRRSSRRPERVSPELFEVLGLFDQWRVRSGGALDASAEAVCRLWKNSAAQQRVPSTEEISAAVKSVRQPHWTLDLLACAATHLDDVPLVLNSFTKSYIASRAAAAVMALPRVSGVVVNIGGDLVVRGEITEPVAIAHPFADAENDPGLARLLVRDHAVATSGGYRRGVEIGGRRYSHIVDPRTGWPTDHVASATVVAPQAVDAGALATSLCVLPPAESLRLVATVTGAECMLVTRDGQRITSAGWSQFEAPPIQLAAIGNVRGLLAAARAAVPLAGAPAGPSWNPSFELAVTLELARIAGQRAKRPYVAVWIEDKDKFPVRTLALWFQKPRWLPDLKSWSHAEQLRALTEGNDITSSVSSATRAAGKYTLKWDGKDGQGQLVKPGQYTVFIEAAREHGTHQVLKQEMEFTGRPQQVPLKGNVEITGASLDYRRKVDGR